MLKMNITRIFLNTNKVSQISSIFTNIIARNFHNVTAATSTSEKNICNSHVQTIVHNSKQYVSSVERNAIETDNQSESLLTRILKKLPFIDIDKSRLNATAFILYESIADKINYADFFEELSLPDTFYSWFVITELHIWMLIVRCMAEGDDGRFVRNNIVQALWSDVGLRVKKLGAMNPAGTRMQVQELSEQFQAALIAYDEGLQSNDVVLAGALWRRLYQYKEVDPEHLDILIKYIRKQVLILDGYSRNELFSQKCKLWETLAEKT